EPAGHLGGVGDLLEGDVGRVARGEDPLGGVEDQLAPHLGVEAGGPVPSASRHVGVPLTTTDGPVSPGSSPWSGPPPSRPAGGGRRRTARRPSVPSRAPPRSRPRPPVGSGCGSGT